MKRVFVLFGAVLLLAIAAMAQQPPTVAAPPNTIYVGAEGRYEAAPDTALVQFNIAAQENTAKAAYDRARRAADQIREVLRANAVDPKSAEIGFFSLSPVYDWRDPKRKLVAYRVTSEVSLKLKDFSKVATIVEQMATIDVTANQSLNYILDDMEAAKIRAAQDGFARARGQAEAVAKAAGRLLGELYYSTVDTFAPQPIPMQMRAMSMKAEAGAAAPTAEFSPQKVVVTSRVNAMFTMK